MTVVRDDEIGGTSHRAIHKLVVVGVNRNQVPKVVFVDVPDIWCFLNAFDDVLCEGRAHLFADDFFVLQQDVGRDQHLQSRLGMGLHRTTCSS